MSRIAVAVTVPTTMGEDNSGLNTCKRKLMAAYHVCASSVMIPAPDEIGLMSISW